MTLYKNRYTYNTLNTAITAAPHNLGFTPSNGSTLVVIYAGCTGGLGSGDTIGAVPTMTGATFTQKLCRTINVTGLVIWVAENVSGAGSILTFNSVFGGNQYAVVYEFENVPAASYDTKGDNEYSVSSSTTRTAGSIGATAQAKEIVISAFIDGWGSLHTITGASPAEMALDYTATRGGPGTSIEQSVFAVYLRELSEITTFTPQITLNNSDTSNSSMGSVAIKWYGLPPDAVSDPFPEDDAVDVTDFPRATWEGSLESEDQYFEIYGGTTSGALALLSSGSTGEFYRIPAEAGQTYYWRVDSIWAGGTVTGPEWSFTVEVAEAEAAPGLVQKSSHVDDALLKLLEQWSD